MEEFPLSEEVVSAGEDEEERLSSLQALGVGVLVDVGGSIATTEIFAATIFAFHAFTGVFWGTAFLVWMLTIGLAGLFAGSFLAARLAPDRPMLHAAVVGVIDLLITFAILSPGALTTLLIAYAVLAVPAALCAGGAAKWIDSVEPRLEEGESQRLLK